RNPYVPTVHLNVRLFCAFPAAGAPVSWFGGGMDLTPYYGFEDDARHFHMACRDALAPFGAGLHPRFKTRSEEHTSELQSPSPPPTYTLSLTTLFRSRNPYVPTVHLNVRLFCAFPAAGAPVSWFGGGMDLTPYYGFEDDARHFHMACRDALAPFGAGLHPRFKT